MALVGGGVATWPASTRCSTGTHTIGAVYSGDGNFVASSAATKTAGGRQGAHEHGADQHSSPTVSGEPVTFTAEVDVVAPGVGHACSAASSSTSTAQPFGTAVPLARQHRHS